MLGTNRDLEAMRQRLIQDIGRIEFLLTRADDDRVWLEEKLGRFRSYVHTVDIVLKNRHQEAKERVVNFSIWRDGGGAIYALPEQITISSRRPVRPDDPLSGT
jgi:hypothetical protein